MFGFIASKVTRHVLEECGVDKDKAKWIGRGVGVATSLIIMDASGFFDIPDLPDTGAPDTSA